MTFLPLSETVVCRTFVSKPFVHSCKEVQHSLVRKLSLGIERNQVFAVDLADECKRIVDGLPFLFHLYCRIFHILRHVWVSPPFAGAEEYALRLLSFNADGHN